MGGEEGFDPNLAEGIVNWPRSFRKSLPVLELLERGNFLLEANQDLGEKSCEESSKRIGCSEIVRAPKHHRLHRA